jgi:hypothetical protein
LRLLFWSGVVESLPKALDLLLGDQGHHIRHLSDICDLQQTSAAKFAAAKDHGFDAIFSGHDINLKSKTIIEGFRQTGITVIFFTPNTRFLHHSHQALLILAHWPELVATVHSSPPGTLLVMPEGRGGARQWKTL